MVVGLFGKFVQDATVPAIMLDPELEKTVPLATIEKAAEYTEVAEKILGYDSQDL